MLDHSQYYCNNTVLGGTLCVCIRFIQEKYKEKTKNIVLKITFSLRPQLRQKWIQAHTENRQADCEMSIYRHSNTFRL